MEATVDAHDLWYDATMVTAGLVVACWIPHGPRAVDPIFDPRPGDTVVVSDGEEPPLQARVIDRESDQVVLLVQITDALQQHVSDSVNWR